MTITWRPVLVAAVAVANVGGRPHTAPIPWPQRRIGGALLLLLAFLIGLGPLARLLFGGATGRRLRFELSPIGRWPSGASSSFSCW